VEQWLHNEVTGDMIEEIEGETLESGDMKLKEKVGTARLISAMVKLRFGGTPKLTEANKLVAGRYITEFLEESRVRKCDRPKVFYKARALVFIRSAEEREEDMIVNSALGMDTHDDGTGWGNWQFGLHWPRWRRRVTAQA
jgi:hypothetical protein